jgi:hypothetical protein
LRAQNLIEAGIVGFQSFAQERQPLINLSDTAGRKPAGALGSLHLAGDQSGFLKNPEMPGTAG